MIKTLTSPLIICTIILFMLHVSDSNADTFIGDRYGSGTHSAWYHSSVSDYGYSNHFDQALTYWNNNSSNVYVTRNYGTYENYQDRYYVGTTEVKDLIGLTAFYQYRFPSYTNVSSDDYWDFCDAIIYENTMRSSSNYSTEAVIMNIAHEIGHTLKLAHTPMYYGAPYHDSVMNNGFYPIYPSMTDYDYQELTSKWGY
jgi:hypothetical protein